MSIDISHGVEPIKAAYDIRKDAVLFNLDGKTVEFDYRDLPFSLKPMVVSGLPCQCADRELILKHIHRAKHG